MKRTLMELNEKFNLTIIATSMHLSSMFGYTVELIEKDGFKVEKVDMLFDNDSLSAMAKSFGIGVYGIAQIMEKIKPDVILVGGDRGESLAGAIVGAHLNIPVAHHSGGDLSSSIDNKIRYAITSFSDFHLVGNSKSYEKLISIGISAENLFCVGEPGLDDIKSKNFSSKETIVKKYDINPKEPFIILLQHPNTDEFEETEKNIIETLNAIKELKIQTIAIYSNSDSGGKLINNKIDEYSHNFNFINCFANIERGDFLGLINVCDLMVGNSSSGIIELPSFKKPFVYVGTRQENRIISGNVINVDYNKQEIIDGIKKALYDVKFRAELKNIKNPYGDGNSSQRIVKTILNIMGI
jgi:UDP-hydrolysing UDP-N-acetyl-D-glucosamine 2-epimerase